jgi:hypothetical protein
MKKHHSRIETPLPVYSDWIEKIEDLEGIQFPSQCVVLFLAADFTQISGADLVDLAKSLILKGVHYICCWGEESEFGHDCFEQANVILQVDDGFERHVMSTWHADESLEEALWFCIFNAAPDDEYWKICSTLAVGIGQSIGSNQLKELLDDIDSLNERIVNT